MDERKTVDVKDTPRFLSEEDLGNIIGGVRHLIESWGPLSKIALTPRKREYLVGALAIWVPDSNGDFALLLTQKFFEKQWERDFLAIAINKGEQLINGRNSEENQASAPHLLKHGDTPYWGGVHRHGIIVAFSGLDPWIDQMISGMVADMMKAFARSNFAAWKKENTSADFVE